jgi:hypothetical protein
MSRLSLSRIFWIGAAVLLGAAALISIVAVLRGEFTDTDGKILGTLGALLLAGGTAVAGLALVEKRRLPLLGWASVVTATLAFAVLAAAIWDEFDSETLARWSGTAAIALVAMLLASTGAILLRPRALAAYLALLVLLLLATVVTVGIVWSDDPGEGAAKAAVTFWILAALAWFLVPVLGRMLAPPREPSQDRIVATLGDVELVATRGETAAAIDPRLEPGEQLSLRRRGDR